MASLAGLKDGDPVLIVDYSGERRLVYYKPSKSKTRAYLTPYKHHEVPIGAVSVMIASGKIVDEEAYAIPISLEKAEEFLKEAEAAMLAAGRKAEQEAAAKRRAEWDALPRIQQSEKIIQDFINFGGKLRECPAEMIDDLADWISKNASSDFLDIP